MPKLKGPLFSLEANGTLSEILTYFRSKGMDIVRANVHHMYPDTANQQTIVNYFNNAIALWKGENSTTKPTWHDYAAGNNIDGDSGYNQYIGRCITYLINHSGVEPTTPFLPTTPLT